MKNYLLYLFMLSVAFLSCETSDINQQEELTIDLAKIESIKLMSESSQRITFKLLNSKEKHYFRMDFINKFIEENDLSENQLALIEDLKNNFTYRIYEKNDYAEYFKNIFINEWSNRAIEYFSMNELKSLASIPYKNDKNISNVSIQNRGGDCKCHAGGFFKCTKQVEVSYISPNIKEIKVDCGLGVNFCQVPGGINDNGEWEEDSGGCGWFWMEQCDGSC